MDSVSNVIICSSFIPCLYVGPSGALPWYSARTPTATKKHVQRCLKKEAWLRRRGRGHSAGGGDLLRDLHERPAVPDEQELEVSSR